LTERGPAWMADTILRDNGRGNVGCRDLAAIAVCLKLAAETLSKST
jgi:hypothetical protein